ncbi:unnamed protein product [Colias eurytheme]|nr:unnamed protein product [Colias eurytheme]
MEHNFENYCRICLDVESKHVSIYEDPIIHLHIKSCLSMTVSQTDNLPKGICESCVSQLNNFYNFQLNARCSQDWLESTLQDKRKNTETKTFITPLPDSEYNSDSLLEFLNSTSNIEEYLNNLGKEDIPVIVNMLDRTEGDKMAKAKLTSPKKKDKQKSVNMNIDVLDSDIEIVKELLMKESEPKKDNLHSCFACKESLDSIETLSQHLSICESASRTCVLCNTLFDSKQKMLQHLLTHNITAPLTCTCGRKFEDKEKLLAHTKYCNIDHIASMGFMYRCKQCKEMFTERFQLYKHAKKHVLQAEQRMCDICGHTFVGNEALTKHRKQEHNKPNNCHYKCKVCSFSTINRKEMYKHVHKHTNGKDSKHLCETCGQCFSTRVTLLRHSLLHSNSRCPVCSKVFNDEKKRDKHMLDHAEMVMCEKCGQSVNSIELNEHGCL